MLLEVWQTSQTLDGKISNLGDSLDALFVSIGENGKGVFGDLIDGIKEAVDWMNEFIEVSPIEKLQEEQDEVNGLFRAITSLNQGSSIRNSLIAELNGKYPELLKNIDLEKVSNKGLLAVLNQINNGYALRRKLLLGELVLKQKEKEANELIENSTDVLSNPNVAKGLNNAKFLKEFENATGNYKASRNSK